MRLIVSIKIPDIVDPVPLDVLDDRSTQAMIDDVVRLLLPSSQVRPAKGYELMLNGRRLDLNIGLSENGVQNGDQLDLVVADAADVARNTVVENKGEQLSSFAPAPGADSPSVDGKKKASVGKKIDFE